MKDNETPKEIRISQTSRSWYEIPETLFPQDASLQSHYRQAQTAAQRINARRKEYGRIEHPVSSSTLYAAGLITLVQYRIISTYVQDKKPLLFQEAYAYLQERIKQTDSVIDTYRRTFPEGRETREAEEKAKKRRLKNQLLPDLLILSMTHKNPAMIREFPDLFDETPLQADTNYRVLQNTLETYLMQQDAVPGSGGLSLPEFLLQPILKSPNDLAGQLRYIMSSWGSYVSDLINEILRAIDFIQEEHRAVFPPGPGPSEELSYNAFDLEYERFSEDSDWMPRVIMLAKSTLVWLDQLSKEYNREIRRLDQIPDQELDRIAERGFTALWLIGLWERSSASKRIKHLCGNPEAEASAYSLKSYDIAASLGGWPALHNLKERCNSRGIRVASDMVPNHTGIDSEWMIHRPDLFLQLPHAPYPSYSFTGENLSNHPGLGVFIEDHYYDRTDAAVTFKRVDFHSGDTRYIYHGNDGTSMPWNDTAQLDYLNPETRELVIQTIIHVARNFSIIRFDAAMTLAKRHIQRLWYPKPGHGGDIPGRAAYGISDKEFHRAMPSEFWREVVDRIAEEAPDTLLLAEAFWMMEGYFVRTLGMHRVYNSAFMNMLKNEDNQKYRNTIKNTLSFDPEILKRFVNFMNNPDEDTAVAQFGDGDKYFGVFTLLITMPGLPMVGHGQIEGYREKYGMEYTKAYWDEKPDQHLVQEHYRRIFPIMKLRSLFADVIHFRLYDFSTHNGINENVYAYSNGKKHLRSLILFNNSYQETAGWILSSAPYLDKWSENRNHRRQNLGEALELKQTGQYYCLFDGFHDGLTYIRPSWELYSQGMYAELKGYQTQIFLNFREVYDSYGLFHELAKNLKGKGTPDWERELALIRLQPLHKALTPFIEPDQILLAKQLFSGNPSVSDTCKQRWLPYYRSFISAWNNELKPEGTLLPSSISKNCLRKFLNLLDHFAETTNEIFSLTVSDGGTPLQRFIGESFTVMSEYPIVLFASLIITPAAQSIRRDGRDQQIDLVHELLLEDFFDEILKQNGVSPEEAERTLKGAQFIYHFTDWFIHARENGLSSGAMLRMLFTDPLFRSFTKTNWSEGVEWYHKESFQESLVWLAFAQLFSLDEHLNEGDSETSIAASSSTSASTSAAASGAAEALSETQKTQKQTEMARKELRERILEETFTVLHSWYRVEPWAHYRVDGLLKQLPD